MKHEQGQRKKEERHQWRKANALMCVMWVQTLISISPVLKLF